MSKVIENQLLNPCGTKARTIETHYQHIENITTNDISNKTTLLLGDSLFECINFVRTNKDFTESWLNCSVGGDGVQHLLYRMFFADENLAEVLNNFNQFKNIIILIGTNNTNKKNNAKNIHDGIINIINMIKISVPNDTRIIVIAIPPRTLTDNGKIKEKEAKIIADNTILCNKMLEESSEEEGMPVSFEFYDITSDFACIIENKYELVSEYFCDDVHFSDAGYVKILDRLRRIVDIINEDDEPKVTLSQETSIMEDYIETKTDIKNEEIVLETTSELQAEQIQESTVSETVSQESLVPGNMSEVIINENNYDSDNIEENVINCDANDSAVA
jgi:hypothetical protein